MTPQRYQLVKSIFLDAMRVQGNDRIALLERACGDDTELRTEVESLLSEDEHSEAFLETPAMAPQSLWNGADGITGISESARKAFQKEASHPHHIGSYRIIDMLGEGGMGVVYRAEQGNPRREVALKVIRPSLSSPSITRRFEFEAQLLGRLQHSGIAQIYEAGTTDVRGERQPYFAMELIDGVPLNQYAREHELALPDRLELFAKICDAVHHAHQKQIIHRDLKPGNILVVEQSPESPGMGRRGDPGRYEPQPKILDFGVARAIDADAAAETMRTAAGQLVGTIAYMSPEQLSVDPEDLDTRSDVYSLGVILYELVSRRLPYDLANKPVVECARIITEEPIRRLSDFDRSWRGDLETIVNKALEKEKDQRYQSASDLAGDVRRFLAHEPILARPQTPMYKFRKFVQRNRAGTFAALVILTLLPLAAYAQMSASAANWRYQEGAKFHIETLRDRLGVPEGGDRLKPTESDTKQLESAADHAARGVRNFPLVAAEIWTLVGLNYMKFDEYERAQRYIQLGLGARENSPDATDAELADSFYALGRLRWHQGDYEGAETALRQSLALRIEAFGPKHEDVAWAMHILASCLRDQLRFEQALDMSHAAMDIRQDLFPPGHEHIIASMNNEASIYEKMKVFEEAAKRYQEILELIVPKFGDSASVARTERRLATCYIELRQFEQAHDLLNDALRIQQNELGADHRDAAATRHQLARLYLAQGALDDAERECLDARDIQLRKLGDSHPESLESLETLRLIAEARQAQ